jgi:hypothetical protein
MIYHVFTEMLRLGELGGTKSTRHDIRTTALCITMSNYTCRISLLSRFGTVQGRAGCLTVSSSVRICLPPSVPGSWNHGLPHDATYASGFKYQVCDVHARCLLSHSVVGGTLGRLAEYEIWSTWFSCQMNGRASPSLSQPFPW